MQQLCSWNLIMDSPGDASTQMQRDSSLLTSLQSSPRSHLRFYSWDTFSITHGYFLLPSDYLQNASISLLNQHLARRPTGGGFLFHDNDFVFSLLLPLNTPPAQQPPLTSYFLVNRWVCNALQSLLPNERFSLSDEDQVPALPKAVHFCMAHPIQHDILLNGKKIGGGAQRRTKWGLLHQGYLSLAEPDYAKIEAFCNSELRSIIETISSSIFERKEASSTQASDFKSMLQEALWSSLQDLFEPHNPTGVCVSCQ